MRGKSDITVLYSHPLLLTSQPPTPLPPLKINTELTTIKDSISLGHANLGVRTLNCTSTNFRRALTLGTTVLHYVGHGSLGYLPFENDSGSVHGINMEKLRILATGITGRTLKLVFLNACGTLEAGRVFESLGVGSVVCIGTESSPENPDKGEKDGGMVEDEVAQKFSSEFYLALSSRKTVREAFNIGLASVRAMERSYEEVRSRQGRKRPPCTV